LLLANMGRAHARLKNIKESVDYFTRALHVAKENQFTELVEQIQNEKDSS